MPHNSGDHATEEALEQYSLGALPESELENFEEHLLVCPSCQDRLAEIDRFIRAFRNAITEIEVSPPPSEASRLKRLLHILLRPAPALITALSVLAVVVVWRAYTPASGHVAAVPVLLRTERGGSLDAAPAGRPLLMQMDAAGLAESPCCKVEIVDALGIPLAKLSARREGDKIALAGGRKFAPGSYWVRVYDNSGRLLREYALEVSENAAR